MTRTSLAPPNYMAHLARDHRGLPVPYVAAWSSETWTLGRDPLLTHPVAILSAGRPGRGKPALGVMHEGRQRRCVMLGLCQVCGGWLKRDGDNRPHGWLPSRSTEARLDDGRPVSTEPLCCEPCAHWAATACPALAAGPLNLWHVTEWEALAQLVDPSRAPMGHQSRFGKDRPAERERLGKVARRHGGAVGYVKLIIGAHTVHSL